MMIPITMYFPKNSYLVEPLNEIIQLLYSSGLINYWTSINEDKKFLNSRSLSKEPKKLTIEHLSGPFQIWMFASASAIVVFVFELFWHFSATKIVNYSRDKLHRKSHVSIGREPISY